LQLFSFTRILFLKYLQWHIHYYYIIELAFFKEITYQLSYSVFRKIDISNATIIHAENWKLFYFMSTLYKKNTHGMY